MIFIFVRQGRNTGIEIKVQAARLSIIKVERLLWIWFASKEGRKAFRMLSKHKISRGRLIMKITSSSIQLGVETEAIKRHEKHESLTLWKDDQKRSTVRGDGQGRLRQEAERQITPHQAVDRVSISKDVKDTQAASRAADVEFMRPDSMAKLKLDILKAMIEKLTGKKIEITTPEDVMGPDDAAAAIAAEAASHVPGGQEHGFGLIYDSYESQYEHESMTFSASGYIFTQDGRKIDFAVDLSMTREFYSEQHVQLREGDALKDPLSVNFADSAAELTQKKFAFDVDADGNNEQISFVKPGSGFLALDRNGDGKINDGRELFGAVTDDGFAELASLDADSNHFIDENDPIYDRLRIWQKDADGRDHLLVLGQAGIGAIFLGHAASPFDLKDQENNLIGRVRSSGVFIRENGSAGTIQQVDLVV